MRTTSEDFRSAATLSRSRTDKTRVSKIRDRRSRIRDRDRYRSVHTFDANSDAFRPSNTRHQLLCFVVTAL